MSKVKILVVEDELIIAEDIRMMLENLGYEVVGTAPGYSEAIELMNKDLPDVVLIDILLAGEKDGITLAETIREKYNLPFIFLTSHSDTATVERAKAVCPDGYLVKPFEKKDLYTSIEIAFSNFISKSETEVENENSFFHKDSIFIRKDYLLIKIRFDDLKWVKSDGNYLELYCKDEKHLVRSSMKNFVQRLPANRFLQVHKSYLLNIEHIKSIDHRNVRVDDELIPVGRAFLDDIKKILDIPL
ncbi:MAG: response regulator [Bacteroidales bacterium]|nr:response regulator [Bacteroidales bacterium]